MKYNNWGLYSVAVLGFIVFIQVMQWPLFPFFVDIYYHLSVMKGFAAAGGYVTHAFWEYAPLGRPHLYPPVFHLILLLLYKSGLSVITVARTTNFLMPLIALGSIWFIARRILSKRTAFFAVLIAASIYTFYLSIVTTIPAMLAVLCGVFSFYFLERGRIIPSSIFLILAFYLHLVIPWVMGAAILLYGIIERRRLRGALGVLGACIVAALPILYHEARNISYLSSHTVSQDWCIEINLLLCLSAAAGIFFSVRHKGPVVYFLALFAVSIPSVLLHPYRYFAGEGVFVLIFLGAVGIDRIATLLKNDSRRAMMVFAVSAAFFLVSPSIIIDRGTIKFVAVNSTFSNLAFGDSYYTHGMLKSIYNEKRYSEVVSVVNSNSGKDEILYSNNPFFLGAVGAITGRATSTATFQVVRPTGSSNKIAVARLIVWVKDPRDPAAEPIGIVKKYNLKKIADTELAFIYRNDTPSARRILQKPLIRMLP